MPPPPPGFGLALVDPQPSTNKVWCATLSILVVLIGPLSMGTSLGFTGPTIDTMRNTVLDAMLNAHHTIPIGPNSNLHVFKTTAEASIFSSSCLVGAIFGTLAGGPLTDAIGRRLPLCLASLFMTTSFIIIGFANNFYLFVTARVISGIAIGLYSFVSSVYISEISPDNRRRALGTLSNLALTVGIGLTYVIAMGFRTQAGSLDSKATQQTFCNWRAVSFVLILFPVLLATAVFAIPETPRWLALKGRLSESKEALAKLRGVTLDHPSIASELATLDSIIPITVNGYHHHSIYKSLCLWCSYKKGVFISLTLNVMTQLLGVNAVTFYQSTIFSLAGIKEADIMALTVQIVTFISNSIALCCIERVGLRPLLLISTIGMTIAQFLVGLSFYLIHEEGYKSYITSWICVIATYIYQFTFALGIAPVRWMITCDIFPDDIRGFASGMAVMANWMMAFIFILTLDFAIKATSIQAVFWFFSIIGMLMIVFVYTMIPETRGSALVVRREDDPYTLAPK